MPNHPEQSYRTGQLPLQTTATATFSIAMTTNIAVKKKAIAKKMTAARKVPSQSKVKAAF